MIKTIEELIAELKKFPSTAIPRIANKDEDGISFNEISEVINHNGAAVMWPDLEEEDNGESEC